MPLPCWAVSGLTVGRVPAPARDRSPSSWGHAERLKRGKLRSRTKSQAANTCRVVCHPRGHVCDAPLIRSGMNDPDACCGAGQTRRRQIGSGGQGRPPGKHPQTQNDQREHEQPGAVRRTRSVSPLTIPDSHRCEAGTWRIQNASRPGGCPQRGRTGGSGFDHAGCFGRRAREKFRSWQPAVRQHAMHSLLDDPPVRHGMAGNDRKCISRPVLRHELDGPMGCRAAGAADFAAPWKIRARQDVHPARSRGSRALRSCRCVRASVDCWHATADELRSETLTAGHPSFALQAVRPLTGRGPHKRSMTCGRSLPR